ncbi:unnamed protein product [Aphanomyces euteiches]
MKIREPNASRFFVKLPAQPKSNGQRSMVWQKEAIAPNNYLCVAGAEIVLLKVFLVRGRGSGYGRFTLLLGGSEIVRSQSNDGEMQHFACIFTLNKVGILQVQTEWEFNNVSFYLTLEEVE